MPGGDRREGGGETVGRGREREREEEKEGEGGRVREGGKSEGGMIINNTHNQLTHLQVAGWFSQQ